MRKPKPDEMITLTQAADLYGFKAGYLRQLCYRGRLKCKMFGTQWTTTPEEMEKFIKSRLVRGIYRKDIK
ncbi:MAG TPA: helix-turn-helix domain-containing protein [Acidiferrobacterales bacterium]|nr:helix-turn-helix domain-containing protein [Acidiferrobacterales bacterium]